MVTTVSREDFYNAHLAIQWLNSARAETTRALSNAKQSAETTADWLLDNPANAAVMMKEVTIEAVRQDAPQGVVEGLMVFSRRFTEGAGKLANDSYTTGVLKKLRGKQSIREIQSEIETAMKASPSEGSAKTLQVMLNHLAGDEAGDQTVIMADEIMRKPFPGEDGGAAGIELHIPCCGAFCRICMWDGLLGCAVCCLIGQGICML